MIYHPIFKLQSAGIDDILIVTGKEHMGDVVNLLGSGYEFGVKFTYKVQDQAGGIAQALSLAEHFVGHDSCVVLLGDNIFEDDIANFVENFAQQGKGAKILIKEVPDPQRYGVAELEGNKIVSIEEIPQNPKSNFCVT
jgi:glucose-1-phosphate thymidylyltransferase